jgi:hypothetical protein
MCKFTRDLLTCVKVNLLSIHMIFFISTHLMVKHGRFCSLSMPKKEIVSILCGSGFGHWTGSWKKDMEKRTFYGLVWPYCSWDIWRWLVDWKLSNEERNICILVSRSGSKSSAKWPRSERRSRCSNTSCYNFVLACFFSRIQNDRQCIWSRKVDGLQYSS